MADGVMGDKPPPLPRPPNLQKLLLPPEECSLSQRKLVAAAPGRVEKALKIQAFPYCLPKGKVWHMSCNFPY